MLCFPTAQRKFGSNVGAEISCQEFVEASGRWEIELLDSKERLRPLKMLKIE